MKKSRIFSFLGLMFIFFLASCRVNGSKSPYKPDDLDKTESKTKDDDKNDDLKNETFLISFYKDDSIYFKVSYQKGEKIEIPVNPIKDNYVFIGWFTDNLFNHQYDFNNLVRDNLNLYAKFIPISVSEKKYPVQFINDGSLFYSSLEKENLNVQKPPYTPFKDGYDFLGWYLDLYDDEAFIPIAPIIPFRLFIYNSADIVQSSVAIRRIVDVQVFCRRNIDLDAECTKDFLCGLLFGLGKGAALLDQIQHTLVFKMSQEVDVYGFALFQVGNRIETHRTARNFVIVLVAVTAFHRNKHILAFQIDTVNLEITLVADSMGIEFSTGGFKIAILRGFPENHFGALDKRTLLRYASNLLVGNGDNAFRFFACARGLHIGAGTE